MLRRTLWLVQSWLPSINLLRSQTLSKVHHLYSTMSENQDDQPMAVENLSLEANGVENGGEEEEEQLVSIETVVAKDNKGIDYMKLIKQFGSEPISPEQIAQIEQLTGKKAHPFLRRGKFFSQCD